MIGSSIRNIRDGVNGTDIPVGSLIRYEGDAGMTWTMRVRWNGQGRKILAFDGSKVEEWSGRLSGVAGQQGLMTVLSLPPKEPENYEI